jgi:hypothetical protein
MTEILDTPSRSAVFSERFQVPSRRLLVTLIIPFLKVNLHELVACLIADT